MLAVTAVTRATRGLIQPRVNVTDRAAAARAVLLLAASSAHGNGSGAVTLI